MLSIEDHVDIQNNTYLWLDQVFVKHKSKKKRERLWTVHMIETNNAYHSIET